MTLAQPPAGDVGFTYNAQGQRIEKETPAEVRRFVYDFQRLYQERDADDDPLREYASHRAPQFGLRFEVKRPLETDVDFHERISRPAWDEDEEEVEQVSDDRKWEIGQHLRCKGSVHSDTWLGTAAELAECGIIAVFPVTGWWKERPHLNCWNRQARYALIVTIETPATDVDLYAPIANMIEIQPEVGI